MTSQQETQCISLPSPLCTTSAVPESETFKHRKNLLFHHVWGHPILAVPLLQRALSADQVLRVLHGASQGALFSLLTKRTPRPGAGRPEGMDSY